MSLRDLLLTVLLVGGLPFALRRPFIGALIFAFISMANPHRYTWGFAYSMPWAFAYAIATMAGLFATQERMVGDSIRRYWPVLLYLAWMSVTTIFAMEPLSARARFIEVAKVQTMCLVTLMLLTDWQRIRLLVWVAVGSIGFYGLKGGLFTLASGGSFLVWGPPDSAIQDNNHLAVGLVMLLPLLYWLHRDAQRRWLKRLVLLTALMSAVSILGSHSRSAFLGILAMSTFLVLKSDKKFHISVAVLILASVAIFFMPQKYWERMATIEHYEQDASAMGRINVWKTAVNIANDRITGGGFEYYGIPAFRRYAPNPNDIHASHSIYFQSLGEHGWIGLSMFLTVWLYVWWQCRRTIRIGRKTGGVDSQVLLARMIQVGLVGFAVGGAFVNIGNWDYTYYMACCAIATARLLEPRKTAHGAASTARLQPRTPEGATHRISVFQPETRLKAPDAQGIIGD